MLTIRPEQLAAFSDAASAEFENWTVQHLHRFFPRRCTAMGGAGLREYVRYGIARAAAHGIRSKADVSQYIDLMMIFGRDFEGDARLPWARAALAKTPHPGTKMRTLVRAAKKHLGRL